MHIGIIGATGAGKTFLYNAILPEMAQECGGRLPLFCSFLGIDTEAAHKFSDETAEEFMRAVFTLENVERWVLVDEVPETIGRGVKAKPFHRLPRAGRHPGHLCAFAFQDWAGVEPIFRSQCTTWIVFRLNLSTDAEAMHKKLGHEILKDAHLLETGNFILLKDNKAEVLRLSL